MTERFEMKVFPSMLVIARRRVGHGVLVRVHLFKSATESALRIGSGEYYSPTRIRKEVLPMWREIAVKMKWSYFERVPDDLREAGR
jgi:hypothetical protein